MKTLIKYFNESYKPVDTTEFLSVTHTQGDAQLVVNNAWLNELKQDGIAIIDGNNEGIIYPSDVSITKVTDTPISRSESDVEYLRIGDDKFIIRKTLKDIQWYNSTNDATLFLEDDSLYRRVLPSSNYDLEKLDIIRIMSVIICEYKRLFIKEVSEPCVDGFHQTRKICTKRLAYVQYGVGNPKTLFAIAPLVHLSFAVHKDVIPESYHQTIERHKSTNANFSKKMLPSLKYQFAFIDSNANGKLVFEDFECLFEHLETGGYIFIHNTHPCYDWLLSPNYCGDVYKVPLKIKEKYTLSKCEIVTLPITPGLTIVRKIS